MGFKYKSTVRVRLDYCNDVYICACFYGPGFDVPPGYNMELIILVNMIIITATFDYICITQSSLNLSYWLTGINTLYVAIFYIKIHFYRFLIYIGYISKKIMIFLDFFKFFRFFFEKNHAFYHPCSIYTCHTVTYTSNKIDWLIEIYS